MNAPFDRRQFLVRGSRSLFSLGLLSSPWLGLASAFADGTASATPASADAHFFLQILTPPTSGADCSYLFDARPLAMTQAGKLQNYLGVEPQAWTGSNGQSTWATSLVDPLAPYRDRFSILNGVHMATGFDGHDQNMNFLLTGNPFGGECFIPHLNRLAPGATTPLDALQKGNITALLKNTGSSVPLTAASALNLVNRLRALQPLDPSSKLLQFIDSRMAANSQGTSRFELGASAMRSALAEAPALGDQLRQVQLDPTVQDDFPGFVSLMSQAFRIGASRSAIIVVALDDNDTFDTHDVDSARLQPRAFKNYVSKLAQIFKLLADTPFDGTRSLWDVTTVMVASEFSRSMRQSGKPIDQTGTDHNPLNNSILIGGKGIKPGLVIGESDYRTPTETLSGAHRSMGSADSRLMGRPFDFQTLLPRADLPAGYQASDYLTVHSLVNTLYKRFGVPASAYRTLSRGGPAAATLDGLLT